MELLKQTLKEKKKVQNCSLYRAVRWLAFEEIPIDEDLASIVYPNLHTNPDEPVYEDIYNPYEEGIVGRELIGRAKVAWNDPTKLEKFEEAKKTLHFLLADGRLNATGDKIGKTYERHLNAPKGELISYKREANFDLDSRKQINKEFWLSNILNELYIDWYNSSAETTDILMSEDIAFKDIEVSTSELSKLMSEKYGNSQKTGRPQKYDWEAFYIQTTLIANKPDGLPEKKAELERAMSEWCDNNWDETPAESMINLKIQKIYQSLNNLKK